MRVSCASSRSLPAALPGSARRALARLGLALAWLVPTTLPSVGRAGGASTAAELFEQGRALLDGGSVALACSKLEQSQQLEPRVGTLLNLADCEERRGRLLAASSRWRSAAELARTTSDDRVAEAERRASALEPRIPKLTVRLLAGTPADATVRLVSADGPGRDLLPGQAQRVDPGVFQVVLSAPGNTERSYDLDLVAGQSKAIDVGFAETSEARDDGPSSWTPVNTAGVVVGGLGVISLIVGAVFGSKAIGKKNDAEAFCDPDTNYCSTQEGVDLRAEGLTDARVSTATFVIGGLLVAGGVALMLVPASHDLEVEPSEPDLAQVRPPQLGLRLGLTGLRLEGAW